MLGIPFYKPSIVAEDIDEVVETLKSRWLTTGPSTKQFEKEFAAYMQKKHAVAVNSCTAALHLALEAIGVKAGQTVVVPTTTFAASAEVVRYFGAWPLLADCRVEDFNLLAEDAERKMKSALAVLVKLSDGGPVFFRQERVGQAGRRFSILKFRSMVANAEPLGPGLTKDGDPRITRVGRFLRKTELDELPQLWNVLRGEMSLVGPRPELPVYVAKYTAEQRKVLALKPGITDLATLEFRNEEEFLSRAVDAVPVGSESLSRSADETERFYVQYCLPRKIELNLAYASRASVWNDTKLILRTVWALGARRRAQDAGRQGILQRLPPTAERGR